MRKRLLAFVLMVLCAIGVFSFVYAQNFMDTKPTMQFSIPRNFGLLVTIYPSGGNTVMWFEAEDGTIRRVLLENDGNFILDVWAITRE
jgi:hypothetical protein